VDGSTVYVGGSFTTIGANSQSRNRIAAIETADPGDATSWDPNASGIVYALAVNGATVYAGGTFTTIGFGGTLVTRNRIAAIDAATGGATSWDPNVNNAVRAIAVSGGTVYAAGTFTSVGGQQRSNLAAINASGAVASWNPNADGLVRALAVNGSTVYAGGDFIIVGSQSRNRIAAMDTSGNVTSWDPNANSSVSALAVSGSTVYAGGFFTSIGTGGTLKTRNHIAAIDSVTGEATDWDPNADSVVNTLAVSGSTVYVGGLFTIIGANSQSRNGIAAIETADPGNAIPTWDPNANGTVNALAVSGSTVYVGGSFTTIGANSQSRNRIAAIETADPGNAILTWNPNANGTVNALVVDGSTVYAGGSFMSIGADTRNRIAAISSTTGVATSWNPNATTGAVNALVVDGSTVYVGGSFTTIGANSQSRNRIAAIETADPGNAILTWDPNLNGTVNTLAVSGSTVYAGGSFTTIGATPVERNRVAAIDGVTGGAAAWDPDANGDVRAVAADGGIVYIGGDFTSLEDQPYSYFGRL
jgi:hypothetical protein